MVKNMNEASVCAQKQTVVSGHDATRATGVHNRRKRDWIRRHQIEYRYEDGQPKHHGVQTTGTFKRIVAENTDQGQKQRKQWRILGVMISVPNNESVFLQQGSRR